MAPTLENQEQKNLQEESKTPQSEPKQSTTKNPLLAMAEKELLYPKKSYSQEVIAKNTPNKSEYDAKKEHWNKVAKINLLGELAATIGGGISAAWGGRPGLPNPAAARLATKRMNELDVDYTKELERYRRDTLSEALRQDKRQDDKTKDLLNRMQWQEKMDRDKEQKAEDRALIKERDANRYQESAKRDNIRQEALMLQKEQRKQSATKSGAVGSRAFGSASKGRGGSAGYNGERDPSRKVVTYIKDSNRKPVAIYPDDWTELYRLADSFNMLGEYRASQSDYDRKQQLSSAIQRAYVERERLQQTPKK